MLAVRFASTFVVFAVAMGMDFESFDLGQFLGSLDLKKTDSIQDVFRKAYESAWAYSEEYMKTHKDATPSTYPYLNFFPMWRANVVPDAKDAVNWKGGCFANNSATAVTQADGSIKVSIQSSNPVSSTCYDHYRLMTVTGMQFFKITAIGDITLSWDVTSIRRESESWDLKNKGLRIMQIVTDEPTTIANFHETLAMLKPMMTKHVDDDSAARNVFFMENYAKFPMPARDTALNREIPEHEIHSGDMFGIIRLDGLDPLVAYCMGATTGHNTMAMWMDGELYVIESTVSSSYWPTDGIQKTPYRRWLKQAQEASYNVVFIPLSAESRAKFNQTAAYEYFKSVEGFEYGYINMLWSQVDTLYDNYPCIPGDYESVCLNWELVEPLFAIIDRASPETADLMWNLAWNKRVGTNSLPTADVYYEASKLGMDSRVIPMIIEQDDWLYNTTRNGEPAEGPAIMCCVLVCRMWRAAGLLDDLTVNCGELTDVDVYSLTVLEPSYEQILGKYTLSLNRFHSKTPYDHMGESCASLPPNYEQDPHC